MGKKIKTSVALSETALDLLKKIADKRGHSMASVLETAIRNEAEKEGIKY